MHDDTFDRALSRAEQEAVRGEIEWSDEAHKRVAAKLALAGVAVSAMAGVPTASALSGAAGSLSKGISAATWVKALLSTVGAVGLVTVGVVQVQRARQVGAETEEAQPRPGVQRQSSVNVSARANAERTLGATGTAPRSAEPTTEPTAAAPIVPPSASAEVRASDLGQPIPRNATRDVTAPSAGSVAPASLLAQELALLARAQQHVSAGAYSEANQVLREYARSFPEPHLGQEVDGLRALIACRAEGRPAAVVRYLQRLPQSLMAERLRRECPEAVPGSPD